MHDKSSLHRFAELIDPEGRRTTEYVIPRLEQAWLLNTVNELIARLGGER
jgi:hypothetical protein